MVMETKKRNRQLDEESNHDNYDDDEEMELVFDDKSSATGVAAAVTSDQTEKQGQTNATAIVTPSKSKPKQSSASSYQTQFSPELLAQYYSRLFPFTLLSAWLSYNSTYATSLTTLKQNNQQQSKDPKSFITSKLFTHREFSFTIEPSPGDEIYIRYQSFKSQKEFQSMVLKRQPRKIDIGAVFSHPPKDHHTIQNNNGSMNRKFQPNQRELVFDIDLTDYDSVRKCGCSDAKICNICWKMMNMAVKVMDEGLREDFGFEHVCWFYSGRRGVHCWVCDESARKLSDSERSAVANYFEVNLGTEKNQNVEIYHPLHPCLSRAYKILEPMFIEDILPPSPEGHNLLGNPILDVENDNGNTDDNDTKRTWGHHLLSTLPPTASAVSSSLSKKWAKDGDDTTPAEKWEELKRYLNLLIGKSNDSTNSSNNGSAKKAKQAKKLTQAEKAKIELWTVKQVFQYCYPRLDINVSKMQNHLLKSPFCVHPKTGRVCVPIDVNKVEEFDPFQVPTLPQLMDELDAYERENDDNNDNEEGSGDDGTRRKRKVNFEWEKTSLNESFMYFQKQVLEPMLKDLKKEERVKSEKMAAMRGDF